MSQNNSERVIGVKLAEQQSAIETARLEKDQLIFRGEGRRRRERRRGEEQVGEGGEYGERERERGVYTNAEQRRMRLRSRTHCRRSKANQPLRPRKLIPQSRRPRRVQIRRRGRRQKS